MSHEYLVAIVKLKSSKQTTTVLYNCEFSIAFGYFLTIKFKNFTHGWFPFRGNWRSLNVTQTLASKAQCYLPVGSYTVGCPMFEWKKSFWQNLCTTGVGKSYHDYSMVIMIHSMIMVWSSRFPWLLPWSWLIIIIFMFS